MASQRPQNVSFWFTFLFEQLQPEINSYYVSNIVQCSIINAEWQMDFFFLTEEDIGNIMYVVKLRRMHATMITMCKYKYYELKQQ